MFKHSFSYYFREFSDFVWYDIPRFFKNIWRFRKELKDFGGWDWHYTLSMLRRSLIIQEKYMEKYSGEYELTLRLKLYYMKRAIYLMDCILDDKFHDMAEARLGYKTIFKDFWFEPIEGSTSKRLIFEEETEEERQANWKVFEESSKIEREVWTELFDILKGDIYNVDMYTKYKDKAYEDVHNGKGLISWWY